MVSFTVLGGGHSLIQRLEGLDIIHRTVSAGKVGWCNVGSFIVVSQHPLERVRVTVVAVGCEDAEDRVLVGDLDWLSIGKCVALGLVIVIFGLDVDRCSAVVVPRLVSKPALRSGRGASSTYDPIHG